MSDRYQVREGSALGHCCVKWSVVDTSIKDAENYEDLLCECLEKDDAEKIAAAMNGPGSSAQEYIDRISEYVAGIRARVME